MQRGALRCATSEVNLQTLRYRRSLPLTVTLQQNHPYVTRTILVRGKQTINLKDKFMLNRTTAPDGSALCCLTDGGGNLIDFDQTDSEGNLIQLETI